MVRRRDVNRQWLTLSARLLLPLVPAAVLWALGCTTFWGGFLFFVVSELIRWVWVVFHPTRLHFKPLVEFGGILGAPLFTLSILLVVSALQMRTEVQDELILTFGLYLCYVPYAFLTLFIFPAFER
jgi:hypothetical protein